MVAKTAKAKAKPPITRHPLFPVMVGLWFAALFGLGSLAIRPTLLESVVLALKIDLIVPAAAPPLGLTARILLALTLFVIGGALGVLLARRLGRGAPAPRTSARNPMAQARPPAFTPAADGEDFERLAAARREPVANPIPGRRRALAMEEDFAPDYRDIAPIPGGSPQILDLADLGPIEEVADDATFPAFAEPASQAAPSAQFVAPMEVAAMSDADTQVPPPLKPEPRPVPDATFDPWNRHAPPPAAEPVAEAAASAPFAQPAAEAPRSFAMPQGLVLQPEEASGFDAPTAVEAPVFAPFAQPVATAPAFEPPVVLQSVISAPAPEPVAVQAPEQPPLATRLAQLSPDAQADLRAVSVESLGVVQLAERLAMAISRRKAAAEAPAPVLAAPAAPQVVTPPPLPQPGPFAGLAPNLEQVPTPPVVSEVAVAPVAPEAPAPFMPSMPAALRPLSFDDHEDEPLDMVLPPRGFTNPVVSAPSVASEPAAEEAEDDNYGSLLGMKTTPRQPFVRIDEPVDDLADIEPVVIFPGQAGGAAPFTNPAPFSAPLPVAANPEPVAPGHRFDVPPVPATAPTARAVDPEETERALKSALATLQRMSGAA